MPRKNPYIPEKLYRKILAVMPVPCVDIVIVNNKKFLLAKRNNRPAKGQWWLVGGRINKNEKMESAARRKIKEECGLKIKNIKSMKMEELILKNGRTGVPFHAIVGTFLVQTKNTKVKLDKQHLRFNWFSKIQKNWHPYVKKLLRTAGLR